MTAEGFIVLGILVGIVALFVSEKYPLDIVAMLGLGVLLILGLVTVQEGFSGFSNPATLTVAAMFILSAGLQRTGATTAVGRLMVRFSRNHFTALVVIMVTVTIMSAFVNNTAAVAVFIPLVTVLAGRRRLSASKLLIPLSYAFPVRWGLHSHRDLHQPAGQFDLRGSGLRSVHHVRVQPDGSGAVRRRGGVLSVVRTMAVARPPDAGTDRRLSTG